MNRPVGWALVVLVSLLAGAIGATAALFVAGRPLVDHAYAPDGGVATESTLDPVVRDVSRVKTRVDALENTSELQSGTLSSIATTIEDMSLSDLCGLEPTVSVVVSGFSGFQVEDICLSKD